MAVDLLFQYLAAHHHAADLLGALENIEDLFQGLRLPVRFLFLLVRGLRRLRQFRGLRSLPGFLRDFCGIRRAEMWDFCPFHARTKHAPLATIGISGLDIYSALGIY